MNKPIPWKYDIDLSKIDVYFKKRVAHDKYYISDIFEDTPSKVVLFILVALLQMLKYIRTLGFDEEPNY
jgi:hypothetical protein